MHPATQHLLNFFRYEHLPPHLQAISKPMADLAARWLRRCPREPRGGYDT